MYVNLLKTAAIITSVLICGFILFLLTLRNDNLIRTYQYFTSDLNGTAKGTILSADVLKNVARKKRNSHYYYRITYAYKINGQQYYSDLFNFKEHSLGNPHEKIRRYPPGKEVLVWYDKDAPKIAVIEKSGPNPGLIIMAAIDILMACVEFLLNPLMWIAFSKKYRKNKYR